MFVKVFFWPGQDGNKNKQGLIEFFFTSVDLILSLARRYHTNNLGVKATADGNINRNKFHRKLLQTKDDILI